MYKMYKVFNENINKLPKSIESIYLIIVGIVIGMSLVLYSETNIIYVAFLIIALIISFMRIIYLSNK